MTTWRWLSKSVADRISLALPPWAVGALVVGDIHGQAELFAKMIEVAEQERLLLVSLGDLVDRGPDNAGALRLMLDLADAGHGLFIRGNHDDKLFRTLKGNPTIVDGDLAVTIEQLDAAVDGKALKRRFCNAYRVAPFLIVLGNTILVHGAMAPAMLRARSLPRKLRSLALYGEATADEIRKKPVRTYRWLASVPADKTVIIGHHPISDATILTRENATGGKLIHLDCGAGKGRGLGAIRLDRGGAAQTACRVIHDETSTRLVCTPLQPFSTVAENSIIG